MYNWALPCSFLQWHLVRFPREIGGESYTYRAGPLENIHRVPKDGAVYQKQRIALYWGTVCSGLDRVACWDALCSGGWVSHRHCIARVWSGNVYVCMSLIWMKSLETLSPVPQQKDMDMHFQFSQPVMCGGAIPFYLGMWSLTLVFVFSKSLNYTVNLFWQFM